jgi:two-component system C4-dicarboxylate transport response regulator DctD
MHLARKPAIIQPPRQSDIDSLTSSESLLVIVGEAGSGKTDLAMQIHASGPFRHRPLKSLNFRTLKDRDQRYGLFGGEPPELSSHRRGILEFHTTILLKHIDQANSYLQDRLAAALKQSKVQRFSGEHSLPIPGRAIFTLRETPDSLQCRGRLTSSLCSILSAADRVNLAPAQIEREPTAPCGKAAKGRGSAVRAIASRQYAEALVVQERREIEEILRMIDEGREFPMKLSLALVEKSIVERALRKTDGRVGEAARLLGVTDHTIRRIISKLLPAL